MGSERHIRDKKLSDRIDYMLGDNVDNDIMCTDEPCVLTLKCEGGKNKDGRCSHCGKTWRWQCSNCQAINKDVKKGKDGVFLPNIVCRRCKVTKQNRGGRRLCSNDLQNRLVHSEMRC